MREDKDFLDIFLPILLVICVVGLIAWTFIAAALAFVALGWC